MLMKEQLTWNRRMFGVVEDEHLRAGRLGGEQHGVLRHVARAIHLALMVDLDLDVNLAGDGPEATELCNFTLPFNRTIM
jgi:hypothetical protein